MPFGKHAPDDRRGLVGDVSIDQKKRRVRLLTRENVEQIGCRRRIRAVVEREIDSLRGGSRHVPDGAIARHRIEYEWRRRRVRERDEADAHDDDNPHHRVLGARPATSCSTAPQYVPGSDGNASLWSPPRMLTNRFVDVGMASNSARPCAIATT